MITLSNDEIWRWYEIVEDFKKSGFPKKHYCKLYNVEHKKFNNMYYRFEFRKVSDPESYEYLVKLAKEFQSSGMVQSKFCKDNNISKSELGSAIVHLSYLDKLEEIRKIKESQSMKFVEISMPKALPPVIQEPAPELEIVEKKNDIEIMITKGVRVSISPNIEPMKLIKIIELLQEL